MGTGSSFPAMDSVCFPTLRHAVSANACVNPPPACKMFSGGWGVGVEFVPQPRTTTPSPVPRVHRRLTGSSVLHTIHVGSAWTRHYPFGCSNVLRAYVSRVCPSPCHATTGRLIPGGTHPL